MTTVTWRRRDGEIGADRQCDTWIEVGKLFYLKDGSVIAGAGHYDEIVEVVAWLKAGGRLANKPALDAGADTSTEFLLATPDGRAYWLTSPYLRKVEILEDFFAIGSGKFIALGAMEMGATVEQAVRAACKFDESTGKGVNVIRVKK